VDIEFEAEVVIGSSPCAKEFIVDKMRFSQVSNLLVCFLIILFYVRSYFNVYKM